jgi:O-antigen/teichoic acid export membrane protein
MSARTLAGMAWVYGSYVASRLMVLFITAILARLLNPSDFGLVALALTFMIFLDVIRGLGPTEWIVVVDEAQVDDWAETVWSLNVIIGIALTGLTAALGPVAAKWFDEPALVQIMPVLGANFLLAGLSTVHDALAQKRMNFRARTVAELTEVVARGAVGISLAFAGAGVWSLVLGYVAGTIAKTVALWIVVPWRPHFKLYRHHLPRLWRFGGALSGVGLMAALLGQFDNIVVARVLGTSALGFYVLATRLPELLIINLSIVAGQVLFPAFATFKEQDMGRPFLTSLHYSLVVALPMAAILAILAEPLIVIAFGDQWGPAVAAMQVLALWAMFSPLSQVCGVAYKAMGRADILFKIGLLQVVLWAPAVLLVASRGIIWVAGVQAVVSAFIALLSLTIQGRRLNVKRREVFDVVWPPVLAAGSLALTLFGVTQIVSQTEAQVACGAAVGAIVYFGLLSLFSRPTITRIVQAVRPRAATS